jgi:hypothetical protein
MEITIKIDEGLIKTAATNAANDLYKIGQRYGDASGAGAQEIARQARAWAVAQDYTEVIKAVAPAIFAETIKEVLVEAIKTEAKKQVKLMRETGELGGLFKDAS